MTEINKETQARLLAGDGKIEFFERKKIMTAFFMKMRQGLFLLPIILIACGGGGSSYDAGLFDVTTENLQNLKVDQLFVLTDSDEWPSTNVEVFLVDSATSQPLYCYAVPETVEKGVVYDNLNGLFQELDDNPDTVEYVNLEVYINEGTSCQIDEEDTFIGEKLDIYSDGNFMFVRGGLETFLPATNDSFFVRLNDSDGESFSSPEIIDFGSEAGEENNFVVQITNDIIGFLPSGIVDMNFGFYDEADFEGEAASHQIISVDLGGTYFPNDGIFILQNIEPGDYHFQVFLDENGDEVADDNEVSVSATDQISIEPAGSVILEVTTK